MPDAELRRLAAGLLVVGFEGQVVPGALRSFVAESGPPAGVVLFRRNIASVDQVAGLIRDLRALWPKGAPTPLVAVDQEGGPVRRLREPECPEFAAFPAAADVAAPGDPGLTREVARCTGRQLAAIGVNWDLAPVLDIDSNPANPIIGRRAFGRDAPVVCAHGLAWIDGMGDADVLSCGKHFPGHGDTDVDSHLALPRLRHTRDELAARELVPFREAVRAGLPAIMTAHIVYEVLDADWPATLSSEVVPRVLREELGFEGVVVSDDLEMAAIADHHTMETVAARGLAATVDLFLVCRHLDRAGALVDGLVDHARESAQGRASLQRAAERVGQLRARATDHAATPWPGELPDGIAADALVERLAAVSSG